MNWFGLVFAIKRRRYLGWLLALISAAFLLALLLSGWARAAESSVPVSDFLVEFPVPHNNASPLNIVVQAPGHVWFTMPLANAIGSLVVTSTTDYQFDIFEVEAPNSYPYDLVYDHVRDGVWFTEHEGNKITFLEPATGTFTETPIPTTDSAPAGIALSPDGTLWFVEQDANQLANYNPDSDTLSEFPYELPDGALEDVAVSNSNPNSIWFTAPGINRVVRYVPDTGDFLSIPVNGGPGTSSFAARRVVIGDNGYLWVSAPDRDRIGLFVPGTHELWRWYVIPTADAGIAGLAYSWHGGRHNLWYTESETGLVGTIAINVTGSVVAARRHALSSPTSMPIGIAVDSNEQIWIAEYGGDMIASWYPPYTHNSYIPVLFR